MRVNREEKKEREEIEEEMIVGENGSKI